MENTIENKTGFQITEADILIALDYLLTDRI